MLWQKVLVVLTVCVENMEVFLKPLSEMFIVYKYACTLMLKYTYILMHKYVRINSRLQEFRITNVYEVHLH